MFFGFAGTLQDQGLCKKSSHVNPELVVEERVNNLVNRMTFEEKIVQLLNDAPAN